MSLTINEVEHDPDYVMSYMLDEILHIDFVDTKDSLKLKWEDAHYRVKVNDVLYEVENLYFLHKLLWDLRYGKIKSLVINYVSIELLSAYRRYVYECHDA